MTQELIDFVKERSENRQGIVLGSKDGMPVFASIQESASILAGTRERKTTGNLIPSVLSHAGPVIVTSTRDDIRDATAGARQAIANHFGGSIVELIFTDTKHGKTLVPINFWDPVEECHTYEDAMEIASSIIDTSMPSPKERHWAERAKTMLSAMLYIAKYNGMNLEELRKLYASDKCVSFQEDALEIAHIVQNEELEDGILHSGQVASDEAYYDLNQIFGDGFAAVEELSSIHSTLSGILSKFKSPDKDSYPSINIDKILEGSGTIYIRCRPSQAQSLSPLISAFITRATEAWIKKTSHLYEAPLDRPCSFLLALDETANIARIPTLPSLINTAGGDGIQIITTIQSLQSARKIWNEEATIVTEGTNHQVFLRRFGSDSEMVNLSLKLGDRDSDMVSYRISPNFLYQVGFAEENDLLLERRMLNDANRADVSWRERYDVRLKTLQEIAERRKVLGLGYRYEPDANTIEPYNFLVKEIMENTEIVLTTVKVPNIPVSVLFAPPQDKALVISGGYNSNFYDIAPSYSTPLWQRFVNIPYVQSPVAAQPIYAVDELSRSIIWGNPDL